MSKCVVKSQCTQVDINMSTHTHAIMTTDRQIRRLNNEKHTTKENRGRHAQTALH